MGSETPKTVSSRLLTMPFMQRAIAKDTSSPSTPATPQSTEPSTKKRKTQHTPGSHGNTASAIDQAALNAALADEERKRQIALDKRAKELGDSRWVLNFPTGAAPGSTAQKPLNVELVGYGHIDKDENDKKITPSRFMRFNMNKKDKQAKEFLESLGKSQDTGESGSDNGDSDSDSSESDAEDKQSSGKQLVPKGPRAVIRTRKSEERARANKFAEQRRKKDVNPNRPKSISAISGISAGGRGSASPNYSTMVCHACGEKGHPKAKCPKANAGRGRS